jgi:hypothetical protein
MLSPLPEEPSARTATNMNTKPHKDETGAGMSTFRQHDNPLRREVDPIDKLREKHKLNIYDIHELKFSEIERLIRLRIIDILHPNSSGSLIDGTEAQRYSERTAKILNSASAEDSTLVAQALAISTVVRGGPALLDEVFVIFEQRAGSNARLRELSNKIITNSLIMALPRDLSERLNAPK